MYYRPSADLGWQVNDCILVVLVLMLDGKANQPTAAIFLSLFGNFAIIAIVKTNIEYQYD